MFFELNFSRLKKKFNGFWKLKTPWDDKFFKNKINPTHRILIYTLKHNRNEENKKIREEKRTFFLSQRSDRNPKRETLKIKKRLTPFRWKIPLYIIYFQVDWLALFHYNFNLLQSTQLGSGIDFLPLNDHKIELFSNKM